MGSSKDKTGKLFAYIYMHELPVSDLLIITNRNICLYQLKSYQTMSHIEKLVFGKSSVRPILLKVWGEKYQYMCYLINI